MPTSDICLQLLAMKQKNAGANAYYIVSFKEGDKQNESELILDTYHIRDSDIKDQSLLIEKNRIYIIGENPF